MHLWVRALVAAVLHSKILTLSLHDLVDTTICHFELYIEQKKWKINEIWPRTAIFLKKAVPGAYPIKILQHKFYAMLIFKHPDWLINLSSQSKCLKN